MGERRNATQSVSLSRVINFKVPLRLVLKANLRIADQSPTFLRDVRHQFFPKVLRTWSHAAPVLVKPAKVLPARYANMTSKIERLLR